MNRFVIVSIVALAGMAVACSEDEGDPAGGGGDPDSTAFDVTGTVVDFATGEAIAGSATLSTAGIEPAPAITVQGASFTIADVPAHSVFFVLAGSPPDYRNTFATAVSVETADVDGLAATVVSEAFLAELAAEFEVSVAGTSVVMVRAVDETGAPRAGIPASAFAIDQAGALAGPFFLGADLAPDAALTATTDSGWVVFFDVDAGLVTVGAAEGAEYTMEMAASPAAPGVVTLANAVVKDGALVLPKDISFEDDVVPIFARRGCENCHSGNGPGRDLGSLTLDGSASLMHREITEEPGIAAALRVDLATPEASALLTMPSAEDPADDHPTVTFASATDPDYLTLLVWIQEGATP